MEREPCSETNISPPNITSSLHKQKASPGHPDTCATVVRTSTPPSPLGCCCGVCMAPHLLWPLRVNSEAYADAGRGGGQMDIQYSSSGPHKSCRAQGRTVGGGTVSPIVHLLQVNHEAGVSRNREMTRRMKRYGSKVLYWQRVKLTSVGNPDRVQMSQKRCLCLKCDCSVFVQTCLCQRGT